MKFLERHGRGEIVYENGEIYNGEWFSGIKHGIGEYSWPDGNSYQGEFKLNMMWGDGKMGFSDGTCIEGRFWKNESIKYKTFKENGDEIST